LDPNKDRDAVLNNLIDTAEADLPFRQELWVLMLREKARHDAEKKKAETSGDAGAKTKQEASRNYIDRLMTEIGRMPGSDDILRELFLTHPDPSVLREVLRQAAQWSPQKRARVGRLADLPVLVEALKAEDLRQLVVVLLSPLPGLAPLLRNPYLRAFRRAIYFKDQESEKVLREEARSLVHDSSVFGSDALLESLIPLNAPLKKPIYSVLATNIDLANTTAGFFPLETLSHDLQDPRFQDDVLTVMTSIKPTDPNNPLVEALVENMLEARELRDFETAGKFESAYEKLRQRPEMIRWLAYTIGSGTGGWTTKVEIVKAMAADPYKQLSEMTLTPPLAEKLTAMLPYKAIQPYASKILNAIREADSNPELSKTGEGRVNLEAMAEAIQEAKIYPDLESEARADLRQFSKKYDSEDDVIQAIDRLADSPKKKLMKDIHSSGLNYIAYEIEHADVAVDRVYWIKRLARRMKKSDHVDPSPVLIELLLEALSISEKEISESSATILLSMELNRTRVRRKLVHELLKTGRRRRVEVDRDVVNAKLDEYIKKAGEEETGLWNALNDSSLSHWLHDEALRRLGMMGDIDALRPADGQSRLTLESFASAGFNASTANAILGRIKDPAVRDSYAKERQTRMNRFMQVTSESPDLIELLLSHQARVEDFLFLYASPETDLAVSHAILEILSHFGDLSKPLDEYIEAIPFLVRDLLRPGNDVLAQTIVDQVTSIEIKRLIRDTWLLLRPDIFEGMANSQVLVDVLETNHTGSVLQQALTSFLRSPHRTAAHLTPEALARLLQMIRNPGATQLLATSALPALPIQNLALIAQTIESLLSSRLEAELAGEAWLVNLYARILQAYLSVDAGVNALKQIANNVLDYRLRQEAGKYLESARRPFPA
jgi:hypothetical protein